MTELVARMEPEAPPDYVTFVGRHIATLRTESDRLTGDIGKGEEIYAEALSDVAARWRWFELLRTRLGWTAVADHYLRRTLDARAKRWRDEQPYPVEVRAIRSVHDPTPPSPRYRPAYRSLGLRQAAFLAPEHHAPAPVAEAAIAWWHAYVAHRRRRRVLIAVAVVLLFTAMANLTAAI
jgi:hypothetical protein